MGKLFCLMGKSSSGKDSVYKRLLSEDLSLQRVVPCTTRPIRQGETNGVEYFFYSEEALDALRSEGKVIELRSYSTVHGIWNYFTADDGQIDLGRHDYLMIGTLESYRRLQDYFGADSLVPLYLAVEDGIRLRRALERESREEAPRYAEMCRRFLADEADFSQEKLDEAGIGKVFVNNDLDSTVREIAAYIRSQQ